MKTLCLTVLALTPSLSFAQNSILFTGRFPFVSLDAPNEVAAGTGGSITDLSEFAISFVTPGDLGRNAVARSLLPATTHEAFIGDPLGLNDYTYLEGFKTYFQRINFAGPFVMDADKSAANFDPRKVFWTVRDQDGGLDFQFFDQNATATVAILPGDFIRFDENGNLEYFMRQADFVSAAGPQTGSWADGASAVCQDAQGNLYYSPAEGGHWINGNPGAPYFAYDGSICRIPASAISYDAQGFVQSVQTSSAELLFIETAGLSPTVREMVGLAGTVDRAGNQVTPPAVIANVVGLDIDPNGGTIPSTYQTNSGTNGDVVPNLVFCTDGGKWAGTIWSTAPGFSAPQPGSIAVINGVQCGSTNNTIPADGSWLGATLDLGNFQPTLMGIAIIDALPYTPLVADVPNLGALPPAGGNLDFDFNASPGAFVALALTIGPTTPGTFIPALDLGSVFGQASYNTVFALPNAIFPQPLTATVGVADGNGYISFSVPNPNTPAAQGLVLVHHGAAIAGGTLQVGNPTLVQYK